MFGREAPVLLPAEGGFPFGRRPKVLLAVGELFVRARSARSRREAPVLLPAEGELFVRARSAHSQARSACVIARRRLALPPRGTKTSTPTAEGRWGAANLSAKPKVRRPPQALAAKPLVCYIYCIVCLFVCLCVCLFVCVFGDSDLRGLRS